MEKPFEIKMNETTDKLLNLVNEARASGIPFYLIELIYNNVLYLIKEKSREEVETAKKLYNENLEEVENGAK